jgi:uncharacterized protein (TIGR02145 family)
MKRQNSFSKLFWLFVALSASAIVLNSCSSKNSLNTDKGVIINGVKWATRNVDAPNTFAATPESVGLFYQWNRKIGWSATDPMINSDGGTEWNTTRSEGPEWEKSNDPCPCGWHVPTYKEIFGSLFDKEKVNSEWITEKGIAGRKFTDRITGKSIFLPSAGGRDGGSNNGKIKYQGEHGFYWSGTLAEPSFVYYFTFGSDDRNIVNLIPRSGFSLRCVAE